MTSVVSVTYTTLGGLRAVVMTDFMQSVLLFGGALMVIATVTWQFGGLGWFPTTWHSNWDSQPVIRPPSNGSWPLVTPPQRDARWPRNSVWRVTGQHDQFRANPAAHNFGAWT